MEARRSRPHVPGACWCQDLHPVRIPACKPAIRRRRQLQSARCLVFCDNAHWAQAPAIPVVSSQPTLIACPWRYLDDCCWPGAKYTACGCETASLTGLRQAFRNLRTPPRSGVPPVSTWTDVPRSQAYRRRERGPCATSLRLIEREAYSQCYAVERLVLDESADANDWASR